MNPAVRGHYDTVADALHDTRPWEESGRNDQQVPSHIIKDSSSLRLFECFSFIKSVFRKMFKGIEFIFSSQLDWIEEENQTLDRNVHLG